MIFSLELLFVLINNMMSVGCGRVGWSAWSRPGLQGKCWRRIWDDFTLCKIKKMPESN